MVTWSFLPFAVNIILNSVLRHSNDKNTKQNFLYVYAVNTRRNPRQTTVNKQERKKERKKTKQNTKRDVNLLKRKRNKLLIIQQTKRKGNLKIFSRVWCSYGENIFHAAKTKTAKKRLFVCGGTLNSVFLLLPGNETLLWR